MSRSLLRRRRAPAGDSTAAATGGVVRRVIGDLPGAFAARLSLLSKRMNEQGKVVLRVELGEDGRVANAEVKTSSGYRRLDDAALNTVKTWRCKPAMRNGVAMRAVALQPFNFILEGS